MGWKGEGRRWNGTVMRVVTRWVTTVGWMDRPLNAPDLVRFVNSTQPGPIYASLAVSHRHLQF